MQSNGIRLLEKIFGMSEKQPSIYHLTQLNPMKQNAFQGDFKRVARQEVKKKRCTFQNKID